MNLSKAIPFLDAVLDFIMTVKENKRLKKELASKTRRIRKMEKLIDELTKKLNAKK